MFFWGWKTFEKITALLKTKRWLKRPRLEHISTSVDACAILGVIVDTEFLEYDLQAQFIDSIKEHNRTLTPLERSEVVGKGLAEIPEIVKKLSGSSFSLEEIKQRYFDFFKQLFATVDYLSIFRGDIHKIIDFAK